MANYKSSAELKAIARANLLGKYKTVVGAFLLMRLTLMLINMTISGLLPSNDIGQIIGYIVYILLLVFEGIFISGNCYLYLNIACNKPVMANFIFNGFKSNTDKAAMIQACILLCQLIFSIPFIIAMVMHFRAGSEATVLLLIVGTVIMLGGLLVVTLIFFPAFYLLQDFPQLSAQEILIRSYELMKGNMLRAFVLYVSFIPLKLLEILSLGVGSLWVEPYIYATLAEFFLDIIRNKKS